MSNCKLIKKTAIALAISSLLSGVVSAQVVLTDKGSGAEAVAANPSGPITANVTVVNDYRFRGISQSNFKPAIQGGFDYAHESGFYIGNWNSSISWLNDYYGAGGPGATTGGASATSSNNVSGPIEMDFYAGFKKDIFAEGFASDLGILQYYYPTTGMPNGASNANTTELYFAQNFTAGDVGGFAKISYALTNYFATGYTSPKSNGTIYPEFNFNWDTPWFDKKFDISGHIGYLSVAGTSPANSGGVSNANIYNYTDWKLGGSYDLGSGLALSAYYIGTTAKYSYGSGSTYNLGYASSQGKNLGKTTGIVQLTKLF